MNLVLVLVVVLVLLRWAAQVGLERMNRRYVQAHAKSVPSALHGQITPETRARSVRYTLAKSRLADWEWTSSAVVLVVLFLSGVLPSGYETLTRQFGINVWAEATFLSAVFLGLEVCSWPLAWRAQFHVEQQFGFNTATPSIWWADRAKGILLALLLGYPLLALILFLAEGSRSSWWVWAWGVVTAAQLVLMFVGPVLILPLFNRFTSLPDGSLRARLFGLADRTGFPARDIQVMDGSKRSRHSNAFFTGLGRFRKIVLFDTLLNQLEDSELEAVLAHEIGHFKMGHIPKLLLCSALAQFAGFGVVALAARQPWLYQAFGFEMGRLAPVLLLGALLSGVILFWVSPLANYWSRRFEYAADAYAAKVGGDVKALLGALRKLNVENLSNLTPHPFYSRFYYSHPTLLERETGLIAPTSQSDGAAS